MARFIANAKVILEWDNGRKTKIGTITIEGKKDEVKTKARYLRQRFGWELVRKGMKLMFGPERLWRQEYD